MTNTVGEPMIIDDAAVSVICQTLTQDTEGLLHPLVILNISDHWTRTKVQHPTKTGQKVFGALLGKHEGRHLEIFSSFELKMYDTAGIPTVNREFLTQRENQYKEVFPELDIIGWYTTDDGAPTVTEMTIQKNFSSFCEPAVFLKLDTSNTEGTCNKLPVTLWENAGTDGTGARQVNWALVSEESERIGVEHVNKFSSRTGCTKESEIAKTIRSNNDAVSMLVSRMQIIRDYLNAVIEGRVQQNEDIIREANKLCDMVKRLRPEEFQDPFNKQDEDVCVALLLSKITEMSGSMNELISRVVAIAADRTPGILSKPMSQGIAQKKHIYTSEFLKRLGEGNKTLAGPFNSPDFFNM